MVPGPRLGWDLTLQVVRRHIEIPRSGTYRVLMTGTAENLQVDVTVESVPAR